MYYTEMLNMFVPSVFQIINSNTILTMKKISGCTLFYCTCTCTFNLLAVYLPMKELSNVRLGLEVVVSVINTISE